MNGEAEPFGDALHAAARTGEGTGKISSRQGADIDSRKGLLGWSPLQLAAASGKLEMVKLLVSRGREKVEFLLKCAANPNLSAGTE